MSSTPSKQAEAERVRRQREAAAAEQAEQRKRIMVRLSEHETERQAALARAQTSARELVANLQAAFDAGALVGLCFHATGQGNADGDCRSRALRAAWATGCVRSWAR